MSTPNLINATPVEVIYLDGKTETVQIARLSIRQLYTFAQHLAANEGPELAVLCTGRSPEWIDTLTPAAFGKLHRACIDLNFPAASEMAKGDPRLAAKLMPFVQDNQTLAILGLSVGLGLNGSSSVPPSSESAAETTSAVSTSAPSDSSASSPPATA
jgi:hypothetical protein